jgi:hypothetical protein
MLRSALSWCSRSRPDLLYIAREEILPWERNRFVRADFCNTEPVGWGRLVAKAGLTEA